jgi:transcriptional regulator of acetoin/glycerol metabolism
MNTWNKPLPPIQQRSVEELIERHITVHHHTMDEIWVLFRNTVVVKALAVSDGNISHAADSLEVHRNTFTRWMKEAGLHTMPGKLAKD